ncbi:MAG: pyruvate formate-lyase-activating protein [Saccharofermentanales bacterium]
MVNGKIHSIETSGTLDGPGIRIVVFMQGCDLRCIYCHNPDTWILNDGIVMSSDDVFEKIKRYKSYFACGGGVTFSGGEPLKQPGFLLDCLKKCKNDGINTVIDTSGTSFRNNKAILDFTDLFILDIKHSQKEKYKKITGCDIKQYHEFKTAVIEKNKNLWLKHVIIPDINDTYEDMIEFEKEVRSFPENMVQKVELLPYHTLGEYKYKELGIEYRLAGLPPLSDERLGILKSYLSLDKLMK